MTSLTTTQAAHRLGVKPATIYAYVSRGMLVTQPSADGRHSLFSASQVELLAHRGRPRQASRANSLDFTIETAITSISQQHLKYRGHDAIDLSRMATFEQVANLLLMGSLDDHVPWPVRSLTVPTASSVFDHVSLTSIVAGAADPFRNDLSPNSVAHITRTLISAVVDSPAVNGRIPRLQLNDATYRSTIAGRLWARLSERRPLPGLVAALNAALVLMADHELAVSTVAARVTASTRADPYAVIGAGVAAVSGPLHGGASRAARRMLEAAMLQSEHGTQGVERAAGEALKLHAMYPGFGHKVYKNGDPRADELLSLLRLTAGGSKEMSVVDGIIAAVRKRRDIRPNIDMALAAFGLVAGFPEDSGESIFAVARIAGWSAHAIEEFAEEPLRFRARAVFVGQK